MVEQLLNLGWIKGSSSMRTPTGDVGKRVVSNTMGTAGEVTQSGVWQDGGGGHLAYEFWGEHQSFHAGRMAWGEEGDFAADRYGAIGIGREYGTGADRNILGVAKMLATAGNHFPENLTETDLIKVVPN